MDRLFIYNGPVVISIGSTFVSHAYLSMKRLLEPTTTRGEAGNFGVDNLVISGHVSGVPEQCSDGTVLTLEMYNGTRLNFTVDKDGVITVIGDVIDHALD